MQIRCRFDADHHRPNGRIASILNPPLLGTLRDRLGKGSALVAWKHPKVLLDVLDVDAERWLDAPNLGNGCRCFSHRLPYINARFLGELVPGRKLLALVAGIEGRKIDTGARMTASGHIMRIVYDLELKCPLGGPVLQAMRGGSVEALYLFPKRVWLNRLTPNL